MTRVKRLLLDVLKPHKPNCLDFGKLLAGPGTHRVTVTVIEKDDQTETVQVVVEGPDIDLEVLEKSIAEFGASLHSIDEVDGPRVIHAKRVGVRFEYQPQVVFGTQVGNSAE